MRIFEPIARETESVAKTIVDAALKVHQALGPGLLESVYELCLTHDLTCRGMPLESQVVLPITYKGLTIDAGLRLDIIVAKQVIVEVKSVEKMNPVFNAQLLTYLKLTGIRLGLLINFNVPVIRDGIKRIVL
ncbi:MAG: GxxExxY protein [Pyrinomonadaceae bacterium]